MALIWLSRRDPRALLRLLVEVGVLAWTWLWLLPVRLSNTGFEVGCGVLDWARLSLVGPFDVPAPLESKDLWLPLDEARWSPLLLGISLGVWLLGLIALEWGARRRRRAAVGTA